MKIGILPLGRPTFDIPFAEEKLAAMLRELDATGHEIFGPRDLLFDAESTEQAMADLRTAGVDYVLLLQVTFTDAAMAVAAGRAFTQPLSIWAVPEPRLGGRLRLNAFCGLNLCSHALGLNGRSFGWLYTDPDGEVQGALAELLAGRRRSRRLDAQDKMTTTSPRAEAVVKAISGRRIARIGDHPDGFHTCAYQPDEVMELAGVSVDALDLHELFEEGRSVSAAEVGAVRRTAEADLSNLDGVDADELDRSLRLKSALDRLRQRGGYDAFALRCWPETFTEYGGAICGPVSMLGEERVPCACEADVYGALTQLILQEVAQAPVFLTDVVDMDVGDDTGVIWHCGQAPISMRDQEVEATATIHTNRKMPLLYQFPLKPGRVTFVRVSQAFGDPRMVLAGGEVVRRPMAFTGTSGTVRFDLPIAEVLDRVMGAGLEHHLAIAYGDHRPLLRDVAAAMNLSVLELA